jgi:DNA ligase-1
MDLTQFTSKKKENSRKTILNNNSIEVSEDNTYQYVTVKSKEALHKYQKNLFCAPTTAITTNSEEEAYNFFRQSLDIDKVEGLMFKAPNSTYSSGLRTGAMAKLKETKEDLDVVIIKAEHGKGKRAGYYSSFYVGVQNPEAEDEEDKYLTIGKVSSGIKELENSEEGISMMKITQLLNPLKVSEEKEVTTFEPKIIIQIRYQEIQKSTIYNSGFALRFPRIITLRDDKDLEEINTINDVERFV